MRVVVWNMRRAMNDSKAWEMLTDLNPDIALLQEITSIPKDIENVFDTAFHFSTGKPDKLLKFGTAILVKGKIIKAFSLTSKLDWVNEEIKNYAGNLTCYEIKLIDGTELNVMPAYSPVYQLAISKYPKDEVLKLYDTEYDGDLWLTDVIGDGLKNANLKDNDWIVAGDFNSSETFDKRRQKENGIKFGICSNGNKERLDGMKDLGLTECLRGYNKKIIPTFKHSRGLCAHQIDHIFVTKSLSARLKKCTVTDESEIFGKGLSDHLPIIADFENMNFTVSTQINEFIDRNTWIFAKTYAATAPHEYLVKRNLSKEDQKILVEFASLIKEKGYKKLFGTVEFTYFDIGNYMYRTMDEELSETDLINRALILSSK